MARENKTKYIILGLLSHEPQTGYDIRQTAERAIGNFWSDISFGQIYPTLKKLEKQKLVSMKSEVEEGQRLKKVYSITGKGRDVLHDWLQNPSDSEIYKLDILLKLYFGAQGRIEDSIDNVRAFRAKYQELGDLYDAYEKNLKKTLHNQPDHQFILLTLRYGQHLVRANLDWAEETLKTLESMK
jgi:DNA-binding PadR family transcriptional regulator